VEISDRDLVKRSIKISCRGLAKRPLAKILYRDLVKRTEILLRDLFEGA
jgi:hypothetical protein